MDHHSPALAAKPEIIAANKMDLTEATDRLKAFQDAIGKDVLPISAVAGVGLERLTETIWRKLQDEND